ncbi:MAG TPA: putative metal-binding motif-containing protein [Myxococcota bacterium]|nr:putative metal-binding motif-containing protein [Myxococcota bacterium]HRV18073.1 putative metal-binding motif-containing protein [Myxococcota bacterium]
MRWFFALILLVAGCGSSPSDPLSDGSDDPNRPSADSSEISEGDTSDVSDERPDSSDTDEAEEVWTPGEVVLKCLEDGGFGCPCDRNVDCNSGFCIDTMDGMRCTNLCQTEESCPDGWLCGIVSASGSDVMYGCIDPFARLCQPCMSDDDCVPSVGVVAGKYRCIERGDEGSFCGVPCTSHSGCPYGFECGLYTIDGINSRHCRPKNDEACPCTEKFSTLAFQTVCHKTNVFGRCPGVRTCDGECDARWAERESCNGIDDDCNGEIDDNLVSSPCDITNMIGTCKGMSKCVNGEMVCEGREATIEVCNGIDDDCNGITDDEDAEGCFPHYLDLDGDGWGVTADQKCLCGPKGSHRATKAGDCDDENPLIYPGAAEVCNGKDDNCDGRTDEPGAQDCVYYYYDNDGDGFGIDGDHRCMCVGEGKYTATKAGDCDDNDRTVYPGRPEVCNNKDDNCDGVTDEDGAEGCTNYFFDGDRDGVGDSFKQACKCKKVAPWDALEGGDCDDNNFNVRPGRVEVCDGLDNDCDGVTDNEGASGCQFYCIDRDGDGYGDIFEKKCYCGPTGQYVIEPGRCNELYHDCDDRDHLVHPGAAERCSTPKDDNCNGQINEAGAEGCTVYYLDKDQDGYGVTGSGQCLCTPTNYHTATKDGDCNDNDARIHPGAVEVCDETGTDYNCNGFIGDDAQGCRDYYLDMDGDGYGVKGSEPKCLCGPQQYYRALYPGDCCDDDKNVYPNQTNFFTTPTACGGFDYNCDEQIVKQYPNMGKCEGGMGGCQFSPGWREGPVPECGQKRNNYFWDCTKKTFSCDEQLTEKTQGCF